MLTLIAAVLAVLPAVWASSDHPGLEERQGRGGGARAGLERVKAQYSTALRGTFSGQCNPSNVIVRREWGNLSPAERQDYIRATRCLYNRPSQTPPDFASGARNRLDDFVAVHIASEARVHFSPWILPFHRWFIFLYEQALRNECGYQGGLPYMGYETYGYQDLEFTAMFDGSPTSFGTNGSPAPDGCNCVGGPFSDFVTNLGPIAGGGGCTQNPQADGLGYNPRCLERKFDRTVIGNLTYENVYDTITGFDEAKDFGLRIEQWPGGLHPTPHTAVGGAQDDIPGSPCDPWFYTHHAGLDRVWAIWQSIDYDLRTFALPPPEPYNRERQSRGWPPAERVTPQSVMYLSPAFPSITVGEVMSTTHGPLCYVYE
ncbi:Putative tyrosinase copper-binding domain, di-copper centre-containing domain superfamily [Septoria linicola]|uniref:Tyrosinase copper-binding domain, di-copper centre-containing domain superfamily n=1 Tax=Septoria linicola TaxID=215465 RepID=A0A9Q9EQ81_9PEZI|nr:Putative tyrosinase copper-binding domain, di-copper centre-containing domain superfamily [Septoria linicola]